MAVLLWMAGGALAADEARLRVLVAADEDQEMFSFEPGKPPGLEREMIEGFAKSHGLALEVVPVVRFEQIIPNLNSRLGDVILGIVDTESRRAQVSFTDEVLPTRHVVVGLTSRDQVRSLELLRMQKVGVVTGSSWAEAAASAGIPPNRIIAFTDTPAMMNALLGGQVNVVVMGISSFALGRKKHPELRADLFLGAPGTHAWAVRKSDVALRDQLNQHIRLLKGSGAWGQLLARYLSSDALALFTSARKP
ncbi:MAG TPA: transporter substrate-binding domain-containing protein [Vicinamibacteria bacterium]|nr:transporter substrate-binding domain-containing protein [Vicinamibacteria bacterium]